MTTERRHESLERGADGESSDVRREAKRMRRRLFDDDDGTSPDYVIRDVGSPEEAGEDSVWDSE
jgi:hypothetical protein